MARWIVLSNARIAGDGVAVRLYRAGDVLDDAHVDVASLRANGLAALPYDEDRLGAMRHAFLAAQRANPRLELTGNLIGAVPIESGEYEPAVELVANLNSLTLRRAFWTRVGRVVHVSGLWTFSAAAGAGTLTWFRASLPVPMNITDTSDVTGFGEVSDGDAENVSGSTASDAADLFWQAAASGAGSARFTFDYLLPA